MLKIINKISVRYSVLISIGLFVITGLLLYLAGRVPICSCGYVKIWGQPFGAESSQHLFDFYTFSHVIHGMIFYFFFWKFTRFLPLRVRIILAIIVECAWELLENSPMVIDRYRSATVSLGYIGDSVINSLADVFSMVIGFFLAYRIPVWLSIVLILAMELIVGYLIRDNLTLNIIMLIYPIHAIRVWQGWA